MQQYPKVLYGRKGWGDLSDYIVVNDEGEEKKARENGYAALNEAHQTYGGDETKPRVSRSNRR